MHWEAQSAPFGSPACVVSAFFAAMITPTTRVRRVFLLCVALAAPLSAQVTESPFTIAPGKLRFEIDGVRLAYERADPAGNKHTAVAVGSTFVSAGLTDTVDLQIGAELFLKESFTFAGVRDSRSGLGDLYFRAKWTFWGSEKEGRGLAVIPYVKVPSNTGGVGNDSVEGGFIIPWAMELGTGVFAGAMFEWDVLRNDDDNGYDAHWYVSGYLQRNLTKRFGVYGEATLSAASTGLSHWAGSIGAGALFQVTTSVRLDYELQRGLNSRATDWTHVFRVYWDW